MFKTERSLFESLHWYTLSRGIVPVNLPSHFEDLSNGLNPHFNKAEHTAKITSKTESYSPAAQDSSAYEMLVPDTEQKEATNYQRQTEHHHLKRLNTSTIAVLPHMLAVILSHPVGTIGPPKVDPKDSCPCGHFFHFEPDTYLQLRWKLCW